MRERFTKTPGSHVMVSDDEKTLAIGDAGVPDDVRLPDDLGGMIEDVKCAFRAPCPKCNNTVRHLELVTVCVAECPRCQQFYWYKPARKEG